ncbi:two-partner secretion domain-containing protein [Nostoc sp.]|uniref:two-partner secretion domain-containing protein n=1 Tax=Nostoc sp. TaxID=1180 RepID=UPI002FF47B68
MSGITQNWQYWCSKFVTSVSCLMASMLIASLQERVFAQIIPDTSLPNNSRVTTDGNIFNITGGTQAGHNLFHSFDQFSVLTGHTASFNNAVDIQNIISRVTGRSISNIDGLIRDLGTADLFLINPNGIIFGPNASLNIGGSFVASTANSLLFADGTVFNTKPDTSTTPLLTVSVPIGLQFGVTAAPIRNQSQASPNNSFNSFNRPVGLQVQTGKTLAIVGGDITLEGGNLTAGRIELGSVAANSLVSLNSINQGWILGYENVQNFKNIQLLERYVNGISNISSQVDASNGDNSRGNIQVQGNTVELQGNFVRLISLTRSAKDGGDLRINARKLIVGDGAAVFTATIGDGNGGNIIINSGSFSLRDGAQLTTSIFGLGNAGNAGNVNVNVSGQVDIAGEKNGFASGISSSVQTGTLGNGGDITIISGSFLLGDRAQLQASTLGLGNAGNVTVRARDAVSLAGNAAIFSTLGSTTAPIIKVNFDDSGRPTVTIEPREQTINPNALGNSGNINITSGLLSITNGARLTTSTFGKGNAGSINLNTQNAVFSANDISGLSSGVFSAVEKDAVGNAGTIGITTNELTLKSGAQLVASSFGEGNAGAITIQATDKFLVNGINSNGLPTGVFAESRTGQGGNIRLNIENLLMLRYQGLISATSGVAGSNGLDGNINIDTKFLVAVPSENSDIIANGFGRTPGSNIQVNAQGIFGTQFRKQQTLESDIVATGKVTLNTPYVDPNQGLSELPTTPVDTKLAQGCYSPGYAQNRFVIAGRGGLPPNPKDILTPDAVQIDWVSLKPRNNNRSLPSVTSKLTTSTPKRIVEATGAVLNAKGQIVLTANSSTPTPHTSRQKPIQCYGS